MMTFQNLAFISMLGIFVFISHLDENAANVCDQVSDSKGTKDFIDAIFKKYANNASATISKSTFDNLMKHLGIGNLSDLQSSQKPRKTYIHPVRNYALRQNGIVSLLMENNNDGQGINTCLKSDEILSMHGLNEHKGINKTSFARLCPSLLYQIDSEVCKNTATSEEGHSHKHDEGDGPSKAETWGFGFLTITIINLLSLTVICVIPCLNKSFYAKVMSYLVALGVGTLSGDALLHLIPHAFVEGANVATGIEISEEDELKQHYSQVSRALFVLLGIYSFFFVEVIMKMRGGGGHGHSHSHGAPKSNGVKSSVKKRSLVESPVVVNKNALNDTLAEDNNGVSLEAHTNKSSDEKLENGDLHIYRPRKMSLRDPGEKQITKETRVATVAWVVIVGDGFHNFSDGLAIGAAFSASVASGLSTAIAVFCHELPHELGDFAILLNSGMTIKQAIVYNFVSAVLAYVGLAVGIGAGTNETGRHFLLSITAGLFLYISLADLLPALTNEEIPNQSKYWTFFWQNLGILTGIAAMLIISIFEHSMEHML